MPKLSPVDQAFFLLETKQRPMNIGALLVLVPPKGAGSRFADQLVGTMLKRPVGPPFNYRLKPGPVKGLLALAADEHMDPGPQVRRHQLPPDSDLQVLFEHSCTMHVKLLRRDAPLWEQHVFTGLPGQRVALYFKTHHGLIDGIGFIRALNTMITTSPTKRMPRAMWEGLRNVPARATAGPAAGALAAPLAFAADVQRTAKDMIRLFWHQDFGRSGSVTDSPCRSSGHRTCSRPRPARTVCSGTARCRSRRYARLHERATRRSTTYC
jgi:hypothetical protein